jgi:intracellular multiplication protein IcmT
MLKMHQREVLWSNTAIIPKLFFLDARTLLPFALWLFHMKMFTFWIGLFFSFLLLLLERFGITPTIGLRVVRSFFIGKIRTNYDHMAFKRRIRT